VLTNPDCSGALTARLKVSPPEGLPDVLINSNKLALAINKLENHGFVVCKFASEGVRYLEVDPTLRQRILETTDLSKWERQALRLVSHTFPTDQMAEPLK
jgi:hypothetical protein